jgi:hypothetical protein
MRQICAKDTRVIRKVNNPIKMGIFSEENIISKSQRSSSRW